MTSRRLWLLSPFTLLLERLFAGLQRLSLADGLFGTRESTHFARLSAVQRVKGTIRRGRRIELYLAAWFLAELLGVILAPRTAGTGWKWLIRACIGYRILDLFQALVNLNLFSPLRAHGVQQRVSSYARTLLLSLWNFFELALAGGIVYATAPLSFSPRVALEDPFAPYYFSIVTQLTIGYGDMAPQHLLRVVVVAQGALGFVIALIALGRFVSLLPRNEPVLRGN